jgi:hypothetical protein
MPDRRFRVSDIESYVRGLVPSDPGARTPGHDLSDEWKVTE